MKCDYCIYSIPQGTGYYCMADKDNYYEKCKQAINLMINNDTKHIEHADSLDFNDINTKEGIIEKTLIEYLRTPKSREEISDFLKLKSTSFAITKYVNPLINSGKIKMTIPNNPKSKNQLYYST